MNRKKYIYLIFMLAVMALIFYFSGQNADESGETSSEVLAWIVAHTAVKGNVPEFAETLIRKLAHFSIYFVLGISSALTVSEWKPRRRIFLWSWLIPVVYACTDELHQYFVPGRSCEFRDVCIDSTGALLGVILVRFILWYFKRRREKNERCCI
jgi:hypothetical protein